MDRERVVARIGERHERLERQVQALLRPERVLDHVLGAREGAVHIAAPQVIIERDIGAGAAFEMLEIRESAGGLEHIVHDDVRLHRRDLVVDGRQFVVFGGDQLRGPLGHVRVARQHHGDRLADVTHLVERQDRLVVKGRAVIGLGDQLADVFAGHDAMHARDRARRLRIDAADAAVRQG